MTIGRNSYNSGFKIWNPINPIHNTTQNKLKYDEIELFQSFTFPDNLPYATRLPVNATLPTNKAIYVVLERPKLVVLLNFKISKI